MHRILDERDIPLKEIYTAIGMAQANFSNDYNRKNGKKRILPAWKKRRRDSGFLF